MAISAEQVAMLSGEERSELLRLLILEPAADPAAQRGRRWRAVFIAVTAASAVALLGWIVYLGGTLLPPRATTVVQWRVVWVGFDVAEVAVMSLMVWSAWKSRLLLIPAAMVAATLLVCDAWFDVVLSWGTDDWRSSVLSAALVEIPLAVLFWSAAHVLGRLRMRALAGLPGSRRRLSQLPLHVPPIGPVSPHRRAKPEN